MTYQQKSFFGTVLFVVGLGLFIWLLIPNLARIGLYVLSFYLMYQGLRMRGTGLMSLIMMQMMGRGRF